MAIVFTSGKREVTMPQLTRLTSSLSVTATTMSALAHPHSSSISISVADPHTAMQSSLLCASAQRAGLLSRNVTDFFSSIR